MTADTPDTLVRHLAARAASTPSMLAVIANERGRWVPTTVGDLVDRSLALAVALDRRGVRAGDRVAVVVGNEPAFLVADLAVQALGAVSAAVPRTDDDESLARLLQELAVSLILVEDSVQVDRLHGLVAAGRLDPVERIVHLGRSDDASEGVDDLLDEGRSALADGSADRAQLLARQDASAPATITFTAGRGGRPRGIVHSARAALGAAQAVAERLELVHADVAVVALEPSHPFERAVTLYPSLVSGAVLAYPEDEATYDQAVLAVEPTFGHVPVERLRAAAAVVQGRLRRNRGLKRLVARWWNRAALQRARSGQRPSSLSSLVVGRPARRSLGWSNLRSVLVTGEAVPADVLVTVTALGVPVRSGYALVETGLAAIGDASDGRAMSPLPGVGVAERGGLLVVTTPYLALIGTDGTPVPLAETGGFDTGDLGSASEGTVRVDGPRASEVTLADGRTVVTADVERRLRDSPYISHAVVRAVGGVLRADVMIDQNAVGDWAAGRRLPFTTLASLVALDEVRQLIADEVAAVAPDVVHHDLLNRPLQQGRDITRTGQTIHGGLHQVGDPSPASRNEPAPAVE